MALKAFDKRFLFYSVIVVALAFSFLELLLAYKFFTEPTIETATFAGLMGIATVAAFRSWIALWHKEFLATELITGDLLQDTFHIRNSVLRSRRDPASSKEISESI